MANLKARSPRKVYLLKSAHLKRLLEFVPMFVGQPLSVRHKALCTDVTKIIQFDCHSSRITGTKDIIYYVNNNLEDLVLTYVEEDMTFQWVFHQNNNRRHISKGFIAKPDLNPIEYLCMDIKREVRDSKPKNLQKL